MYRIGALSMAVLSVAAMAAIKPPMPRGVRGTCDSSSKAILVEVTNILSAGTNCSGGVDIDPNNDTVVAIGQPSTDVNTTLAARTTSNQYNCAGDGGNNADDTNTCNGSACFPTTSNYWKGQMYSHLSKNNSRDMRIFNTTLSPSASVTPGTKYSTVAFMSNGGTGNTMACYDDASAASPRVFCKVCATP